MKQFFDALWKSGMKSVYREGIPKEMMLSSVDEDGWFEWKPIPGTLTDEDYHKIEKEYNITFPNSFIAWHKSHFFLDGDCSILRLPNSEPAKPLEELTKAFDSEVEKVLMSQGFIPFADEGNDSGPLVFDTNDQEGKTDYPIRIYDHEYDGGLEGLSEIIFSSFTKLLECVTHLLKETESGNKQDFEVIEDFFEIDPDGAGSSGREYWECWIGMSRDLEEWKIPNRIQEEQAIKLAKEFVHQYNQENPIDDTFYYEVDRNPKDFATAWYFDFQIRSKSDLPEEDWPRFGGAPGYLISKEDNKVQVLANWEYVEQSSKVIARHRTLDLLNRARLGEVMISDWKEHLSLSSKGLLSIKRKLQAELNKDSTEAELIQLLHWIEGLVD